MISLKTDASFEGLVYSLSILSLKDSGNLVISVPILPSVSLIVECHS